MAIRTVLHDAGLASELRVSTVIGAELPLNYAALSIKHVIQGEERYRVRGRLRTVRAGEHLLIQGGGAGEVFALSPYAYMLQQRLDEAHRLLVLGGRPVAEVALDSGFNDAATFSRAFKRQHGRPPSSFIDRARMVK